MTRPALRLLFSVAAVAIFALLPILSARAFETGVSTTTNTTFTTTTSTLPEPQCGNWTVTFGTGASSVPVGALQIYVNCSAADGQFVRDGANVWCTGLLEGADVRANEITGSPNLVIGVISVDGIEPGTDFVSCVFDGTFEDPPLPEDFVVEVKDASDVDGQPISVLPTVRVSERTEPGQCGGGCGDGVVTGEEECDDANTSYTDACTFCRLAFCGDYFVQDGVEECDDGNTKDQDDCVSSCSQAFCGDGYVRDEVEACDDGNADDTDDCVGCMPAHCGDGVVQYVSEQCDDAGTTAYDGCSRICRFEQTCGNPIPDGAIKSGDALRVLRKGVGLAVDCPGWVCDVNDSGEVTTGDALRVLQRSVSSGVPLHCGYPDTILIRAYKLAVHQYWELQTITASLDYSMAPGGFSGSANAVDCNSLVPSSTAQFFDDEEASLLTFSIGGGAGVQLPTYIARCRFSSTGGFGAQEFQTKSLEAKTFGGIQIPDLLLSVVPD